LADQPSAPDIPRGAPPRASGGIPDRADISDISSQAAGMRRRLSFPVRERRPAPPDAVDWP
jgi:hypothetical protein